MEKKGKKYTLKIKDKEVEVNEEIYRAYIRPVQAEQRQKRRVWKCRVLSKSGNYYVRCTKKCETCPYYLAGNSALGNVTSLGQNPCFFEKNFRKNLIFFGRPRTFQNSCPC